MLAPWEQILKSAQNVLFNEELFAQLAKEAFDQRSSLQGEVLTDRINIPLTTKVWLSVLLVREYDRDKKNDKAPPPDSLPSPNWELTVSFKQLLRANHQYIAMPRPPRPSNARPYISQEMREAGASAYSTAALKQLEYDYSIFNKLLKMARHIDAQGKVHNWLTELSKASIDPILTVVLIPSLSLTSTTFAVAYTSHSVPYNWRLDITLSDGVITWTQKPDGQLMSVPVDKERLLGALKRQAVLYILKAIDQIAFGKKWCKLLESTLPNPSLILMKQKLLTSLASSILIESPKGTRLELLIEYGQVIASISTATHSLTEEDIDTEHRPSQQSNIITLSAASNSGAGLLSGVIKLMESLN
ncbi:PREDICTED: mediator of RNA polymerase II transcription subunit 17-like [Amphimedon queenslandica]|uniref:Uncharacterized protein n=1 Tax=Amphimedon queenslandica TaxID=400682 RepID=A0A1X7UA70_AMPQE|nr:PREDICTED: mediator of RNA polymerase II transcription subunit 17-like [Amphimedon queenslandica]|eukprot:XP_019855424.1 PREDICTED: mediator of RNA polymerase II transcription subunit 17-like [Amphimedon queenslandica]